MCEIEKLMLAGVSFFHLPSHKDFIAKIYKMNFNCSVKSEKFEYHSYFILLMHENGLKSFNR